jgi:hypothetical protein
MQDLVAVRGGPDQRNIVLTRLRGPLRGSAPIVFATALVAVLGIGGTAGAAKLITGSSIKDGSITAADLSKKARTSLHGAAGARGIAGGKGDRGSKGPVGMTGAQGAAGAAGSNGTPGAAGSDGSPGVAGTNGAPGAAGSNGSQGAAGSNGSQGAPGGNGTNGTNGADAIRYFAAVAADGTLSGTRVRNVASATKPSAGTYDLQLTGAQDFSTCVAVAQVTDSTPGHVGDVYATAPASGHVTVNTFTLFDSTLTAGVAQDRAFVVTISC